MEPIALRPAQAAKFIGLSRSRVYELINEKRLQTAKIGAATLITTESLRALVAASMQEAG